MTLEEYSQVGNPDSFTNWLEGKTEELGSIWGGSAFKFGIFERKSDDKTKANESGRSFGEKYAWYSKYGSTPEEAYIKVRSIIIGIAEASNSKRFSEIEAFDLGHVIKWKIAFLYQPHDEPALLPIYKISMLQAATGSDESSYYKQCQTLLNGKGKTPLFTYAEQLWNKANEVIKSKFGPLLALDYLQQKFGDPIKEPTKKVAGFEIENGHQIALLLGGQKVELFVEPRNWADLLPNIVLKRRYEPHAERNSNLEANAPRVSVGNSADLIQINSLQDLEEFSDKYAELEKLTQPEIIMSSPKTTRNTFAKNKILYGPPGTGKTFKTAQLAVEICDGSAELYREALMARYNELTKEGRINFVTFHQSYGYEDFVQGLRPEVIDEKITYRVRNGIFIEACNAARLQTHVEPGLTGKPLQDRTIYKMSLGKAGTPDGRKTLQACLENNYIVLGWGSDIDFSDCSNDEMIKAAVDAKESLPESDRDSHFSFMKRFKHDLKLGDIVIISQGNTAFRAIGEVTGEYQFEDPPVVGEYYQARTVRWLAVFESNRSSNEIYGAESTESKKTKKFTQLSLYKLKPSELNYPALETLINKEISTEPTPHVLIIDEINRANISKVFGELITLLEEDKREGKANAISLKLPYSDPEESFCVPDNLYIIGTMNTADRSIALLDTALRRRFEFEELLPDYSPIPDNTAYGINLRLLLQRMNQRIEYLYDRDHTLGQAYFMNVSTLVELDERFRRKVIPLLQEYFYEDWSKIRLVLNDKKGDFITADSTVPAGILDDADGFETRTRYSVNEAPFSLQAFLSIYQ